MSRISNLTRHLRPWLAVAVAALVSIEIVRTYQAGDPRGIAAVAAIVATTVSLYLATIARDAADTLAALAAATTAGVAALEAIERSLGEIEHAAGLTEESLDLLATAAIDALTSLDGQANNVEGVQRHASPAPAEVEAREVRAG